MASGDRILKVRRLLVAAAGEPENGFFLSGARPAMLMMTDGQTSRKPYGWSLTVDFVWSNWAD